jgi:hydrogenase nickel incorporation protein HypA/HybF
MHEASMVESLIEMVQHAAPEGRRVRRVDVKVGLLTGVSPEALHFYFEAMREETLGLQAELFVTVEPLRAHCDACGRDHSFREATWMCPDCGQHPLSYQNGDELHVCSFEVEDGEGLHD